MIRLLALFTCAICSCTFPTTKSKSEEIIKVLQGQAAAWNKGNLEGYMSGYWMTDSLVFTGGKTTSYGWQAALDRYMKSYPTAEKMGKLEFSDIETRFTSKYSAYTVGQWSLSKSDGNVSGRFTLVWKKINGSWFIVADHSS